MPGFGDDVRRVLEDGWQAGWRVVAKVLFAGFVLVLLFVAIAARSVLLSLIAGGLLVTVARAFLPEQRFQRTVRSYATGDAGDRWRRRFSRVTSALRRLRP